MASKVDLSDLQSFVRVAERESFSAAARELGVPTSTVSRSIARLEDALGVRLLERTTRKVVPTASGKALFGGVVGPLRAIADATATVASFHERPCGVVRVTAPIDLEPALAGLVTSFLEKYPEVSVEVVPTNRYVDLIAEGFDVALRAGAKLDDSSLVARKVGDMVGHLFAAPAYLKKHGTPKAPADLESHQAVLFRGQDGSATWALQREGQKTSVVVKGRVSADDLSFVRAACVAGAGIAWMPEGLCRDDVRDGLLVRVLAPWATSSGALHVVVPSTKHLAPRVAVFRDYVLENFFPSFTRRRS